MVIEQLPASSTFLHTCIIFYVPVSTDICMYIVLQIGGPVRELKRTSGLNKDQESVLERSFEVICYPNKTILRTLALQTGLNELQVYGWFARKRRRVEFENSEGTQSLNESQCYYYRSCISITVMNDVYIVACNKSLKARKSNQRV